MTILEQFTMTILQEYYYENIAKQYQYNKITIAILQRYYNSITMTILQQQQQHEQELESFR